MDASEPSQPSSPVEGIDVEGVTAWFVEHAPTVTPPLRFELITGGHSNLTFSVTDADGRHWVLRRPPLGQVLATAHDMGREHRIISALAATDVPVAPDHRAVHRRRRSTARPSTSWTSSTARWSATRSVAERLSTRPCAAPASESIVDVLARIHAVDLDAVGLDDLGRHEGYIERQLKRWYGQFEKSKTRERARARRGLPRPQLARSPSRARPRSSTATTGSTTAWSAPTATIMAVLDWEICTLGDPLADLGLLMVYWTDPDDASPGRACPAPPSSTASCASAELLDALRRGLGPRPVGHRLLRRLRLLEAGLHHRGRVRPLQGRRHGPPGRRGRLRLLRGPGRRRWSNRPARRSGGSE